MASQTTVYDIVTRYRTEVGGLSGLESYTQRATLADRATTGLGASIASTTRLARPLLYSLGGMVGVSSGIGIVAKVFSNLNTEMNSSLQLASQINLAFEFAPDPVENFNQSLAVGRGLIRDLAHDAAWLPGTLSDFLGATRIIAGPVFGAGGNLQMVRDLTAKIALASPAAGTTPEVGGRQAMRILTGTASVADSTLFALLQNIRGGLPNTETFNALPAAERLRLFDEALSKFTDNPAFRKNIIGTFDTQLGTLADNLFGMDGVLGRLGRNLFGDLLEGLTNLNTWLDQNKGRMVEVGQILIGGHGQLASRLGLGEEELGGFLGVGPRSASTLGIDLGSAAGRAIDLLGQYQTHQLIYDAATNEFRKLIAPESSNLLTYTAKDMGRDFDPRFRQIYADKAAELDRLLANRPQTDDPTGKLRDTVPNQNIVQHITLKIDHRSDDSPEGVAVRVMGALRLAAKRQTSLAPQITGTSPTP